ncbi:MAG: hypothetical protein PVF43_08350 [Candidatus Eiseniibacteriota bacterium]
MRWRSSQRMANPSMITVPEARRASPEWGFDSMRLASRLYHA